MDVQPYNTHQSLEPSAPEPVNTNAMEGGEEIPKPRSRSAGHSSSHSSTHPARSFFSLNITNLSYQPQQNFIKASTNRILQKINTIPYLSSISSGRTLKSPPTLHNINVTIRSGKITALLGAAEERKELIELIVGRKKLGIVKGDIIMKGNLLPSSKNTTTTYLTFP